MLGPGVAGSQNAWPACPSAWAPRPCYLSIPTVALGNAKCKLKQDAQQETQKMSSRGSTQFFTCALVQEILNPLSELVNEVDYISVSTKHTFDWCLQTDKETRQV